MKGLTKREKALSRELIDKCLQKECDDFLNRVRSKIDATDDKTPHKKYLDLYKMMDNFDNLLNRRYGNISGGRYLTIVTSLYVEGLISDDDIAGYEEENRIHILKWKSIIDSCDDDSSKCTPH